MVLFPLLLAACSGGGGGGGSDETPTSVDRAVAQLQTITLNGNETRWVRPDITFGRSWRDFNHAVGSINEMVFKATNPIYIDGIRTGETVYFDTQGLEITSVSSYFPFYFINWQSSSNTPSAVTPPIHVVAADFPSGSYEYKLTNPTGSQTDVTLYQVYKNDPDLTTGQMDLNFFVYTAGGEPNELIYDDASAAVIRGYINQIFSQAGVSVGSINLELRDDPVAVSQVLSDAGMISFLRSASLATAGRTDTGVNCFLFPRLAGNTLGVDGAIPGPGLVHGTSASGLIAQSAIAWGASRGYTQIESNQFMLAKILAHEIGHYLGLYHTNESNGSDVGAVTDTPDCPGDNDGDGSGTVTGRECRGKGADYLMFWTTDGALIGSGDFQIKLSPQQGQVINTHPSVL